jgi:hypothetical protein
MLVAGGRVLVIMLSARVTAAAAVRRCIAVLRGAAGHFMTFGALPFGAAGHRLAIFAARLCVFATAGCGVFGVIAPTASHRFLSVLGIMVHACLMSLCMLL